MSTRRSERRRKRRRIRRILVLFSILAVLVVIFFLAFPLQTVIVNGNVHESAESITGIMMERPTAGNTVLAWLMNRNRSVSGQAFVSSLDAELVSSDTIRVTVTEKRLTGYVRSGKRYYYIGKDGTVETESSKTWENDGIPEIEGLELLTDIQVGDVLPIRGTKPFVLLDNLKSLTDFYDISPEKVTFSEENFMTLQYGNVQVCLGTGTNMEDRIKQLAGILKEMDSSWSGTLHLENYNGTQSQIVFDRSDEK